MKQITLLFVLCLSFLLSFSQAKEQIHLMSNLSSFDGRFNFPQKFYRLSQRIEQFQINDSLVTFQLRNKRNNGFLKARGKVVQFDLKNEKLLWNFVISYVYEHIISIEDYFFYYTQTNSYRLHPVSGKKMSKLKTNYIYVDTTKSIGLGYPVKIYPDNVNRLEAVDLTNGKKIWEREVKRSGLWSNVEKLNDSCILVLANGLEKINLYNGKGWVISSQKDELSERSRTAAIIGGYALGGIFGGIIISVALPTDMSSIPSRPNNLISEGDSTIYASLNDRLVKSDYEGNEIWSTKVMDNDIQLSELIKKENKLILVYTGQYFDGKRFISRKRPKLAVHDAKSGEVIFKNDLKTRSYYALEDYSLVGDSLLLIYSNELVYFDLNSDSISQAKKIEGAGFTKFISEEKYHFTDSALSPLSKKEHFYLLTANKRAHELDLHLNIKRHFKSSELYHKFLGYKNLELILNQDNTKSYLIDEKRNIVLELPAITQAVFKDNKLYYSHQDYFLVLDLSVYLESE